MRADVGIGPYGGAEGEDRPEVGPYKEFGNYYAWNSGKIQAAETP